jgi:hypothetical protein
MAQECNSPSLPVDVMRKIYENVVKLDDRSSRVGYFTYEHGPTYRVGSPITKDKMETLTSELNMKLPNGYRVKREAICEGGFCVYEWPGSEFDDRYSYKSIRFTENFNGGKPHDWPTIKRGDDWSGDETIIFEKGYELGTYLKAFHGAPCWTMQELNVFTEAFASMDITLKPRQKTKLAEMERDLICRGTLGVPFDCYRKHKHIRRCTCRYKYRTARDILERSLSTI